jgi:ribosome-associated protein
MGIIIKDMNEFKQLLDCITEGIKDKKGKGIRIVDLTKVDDTICKYLVICEGNSPSQISAIYDSVRESARKGAGQKPVSVDGLRNCLWIAMDYVDVVVHIFLPETREFYDVDNLWEDADYTDIPDLD